VNRGDRDFDICVNLAARATSSEPELEMMRPE